MRSVPWHAGQFKQKAYMLKILKKVAAYIAITLGVMYGYEFLTGESLSTLPGKIINKLYHPEVRTKSGNPHYYKEPEETIPETERQ